MSSIGAGAIIDCLGASETYPIDTGTDADGTTIRHLTVRSASTCVSHSATGRLNLYNVTLTHCGVGMYVQYGKAVLQSSLVTMNNASGVVVYKGQLDVVDSIVSHNTNENNGGGIICYEPVSLLTITGTVFHNNYAQWDGGCVAARDGCSIVVCFTISRVMMK